MFWQKPNIHFFNLNVFISHVELPPGMNYAIHIILKAYNFKLKPIYEPNIIYYSAIMHIFCFFDALQCVSSV